MFAISTRTVRLPGRSGGWRDRGGMLFGAILALLALAGLGLATYLAVENLQGQSGVCTGLAHGCAAVQQSQYGRVLGVPVSVPGAVLYGLLALVGVAWATDWRGWRPTWAVTGGLGASSGFAFSMYLTAIEAFVLDQWCVYCVASALIMTGLAVLWVAPVVRGVRESRQA